MVAVCLTSNHLRLHTKRTIDSDANQRPSIRPLQFRPDACSVWRPSWAQIR